MPSPSAAEQRLVLESVDQYLSHNDPPTPWLIDRILPKHGRLLLVGDAKRGKSLLVLQMAFSLAAGIPFLGLPIVRPVNVVYLQYELRRPVFKPRLLSMARNFPPDTARRLKVPGDSPSLKQLLGYTYRDIPLVTGLRQLGDWPDVVILDPLVYWLEGDENDNVAMKDLLLSIDACAEDNFGVVVVHHTHKAYKGQARGQSQSRGASSLPGWTESNLVLNGASGSSDPNRLTLSFDLRASAPLDDIELIRDPDTLLCRRMDDEDTGINVDVLTAAMQLDPTKERSVRDLAGEIGSLHHLSSEMVRKRLERAGWKPGVKRGRPRKE